MLGSGARPRRRGWWNGPLLLAAVAILVALGGRPGGRDADRPTGMGAGGEVSARVREVIDGDTIVVELPGGAVEHVRYIGVDTPESTPDQPLECFGHEAAEENRRLVGERLVRLRFGPERRDDYGRLLAYVEARGQFVNAELVARGFARTLTISPNDARAPLLRSLEAQAGRAAIGLWGTCSR